jgi:hypothetical protein
MLGRRAALGLGAGLLLRDRAAAASTGGFAAAGADAAGNWRLAAFGLDGSPKFDLPIPARGHSLAVAPGGDAAVLFARRPGQQAWLVGLPEGRIRQAIPRGTERWFCGHGVFSADGTLLYATEIDGNGQGIIGVYAAARGFDRIGEFPSHGLDPHDIRLAPDGLTLIVANGGIRTDPRLPRARLDLDGMDSGVAHFETSSGRLATQWHLPEAQRLLSLRHLALAGDAVFVAMQHEGPRHERQPLVAMGRDTGLAMLEPGLPLWRGMDHYAGSAAASADGRLVAVTSPRGGIAAVLDARSLAVLATVSVPDGCGVAATPGGFVVTSGLGGAAIIDAQGEVGRLPGEWLRRVRWDNHLVPI